MLSLRKLVLPLAMILSMGGLAGCATSGPTFQEMQSQISALPQGEGRIIIYRSDSALGAGVQPAIKVNGVKVGDSVPNGFIYIDRPAGNYEISTSTEVKRTLSLTLADQETKYVRTRVTMGFLVGHVSPELVDPVKGAADIKTLHHLEGN